jgi:hypothetical protein
MSSSKLALGTAGIYAAYLTISIINEKMYSLCHAATPITILSMANQTNRHYSSMVISFWEFHPSFAQFMRFLSHGSKEKA